MNRKQFTEAIQKIPTKPYQIKVNIPSDGAMQRGCFLEDGLWKVYETDAGGHIKILFKSRSEDKAFSWLYQLLCKPIQSKKKELFSFWK